MTEGHQCKININQFKNNQIILASLLIMSISYSFAAIIGIKFGNTKIYNNKSLEGSFIFFIITFMICYISVPDLFLFKSIFISLIVTIIEMISFHNLNDNFTVPISAACLIKILL